MDLRQEVLEKRYFRKNENGKVLEDWSTLCDRVAFALSDNDLEQKNKFYEIMKSYDFLPNSPTLMNAGIADNFSLSACFVIPVEDSIDSIFDAVKNSAKISKSGGGVGYNFSKIRPEGSIVGSTQGVASGPLSFMKIFDTATETIKQGGRRRGAQMAVLNCGHPDIEKFIEAKQVDGEFSNFNFSVAITEMFMECVKADKDWSLIFNKKIYRTIKAKDLWNKIIENAWDKGEPGILFIDEINKHNPLKDVLGDIDCCNPCGWLPL